MDKHYAAVIFDFDMTLGDTSKVIVDLLNECAHYFGYREKSYEEILPVVGNSHEIMIAHVTGERDPQRIMQMRTYYRQLCLEEMTERTELFPDVPECLRKIYGRGIHIGLLSLKLREVLLESLKKYNLLEYFDAVTGCEEAVHPKPDPSGLLSTIDIMRVEKESVLYVGDSLVDQDAALAANVDFAAMLRGGTRKEEFDKRKVVCFYNTLTELWNDIQTM